MRHLKTFILFGTIRFNRRQSLVQNIHLFISVEVEFLELVMEFHVICHYLPYKLLSSFLDFLLVNIECHQIDFYWSCNGLINDICWFKLPHPGMTQYLPDTTHRSQPSLWIFDQKTFKQHSNLLREIHVRWKGDLLVLNRVVYFINISRVKRRISSHQFIKKCTQTVIINCIWMSLSILVKSYLVNIYGAIYYGLPQYVVAS